MLMAGVMTVLQPASIYAADMAEEPLIFEGESVSEDLQESPETVEDNGSHETLDDGGFISDFDTVDTEESVEDDSVNLRSPSSDVDGVSDSTYMSSNLRTDGQPGVDRSLSSNDDSGGDIFIQQDNTEDITIDESNINTNPLSLTWNGIIPECNDQNVLAEIRKEDGTELSSSEMLILNSINKDVKKELENKIQKQMIGVSVLGVWAFNLERKDGNGNDVEKNAAYRIQIKMMNVSKFKDVRLYHQKENGDMEEITFTSGVSENDMQKLEFVSSDGLGDFIFAYIEEDLTINNNVSADISTDTSTNASSDKSTESNDVNVGSDLTSIYACNEGVKPDLSTSDNLQADGQPDCSGSDCLQHPSPDGKPGSGLPSIDEELTINDNHAGQDSESKEGNCDSVNDVDIKNDNPETVQDNPQAEADTSSNNDADGSDRLSPSSSDLTEDNTSTGDSNNDTVTPIDISEFHVSLVSGADKINDKYIWNPSDPAAGHSFIYRVSYTMSGTFSTDVGAFKIEVPLHILKDKDGNWADTFICPYMLRSSITENDNPDFVYEIDEENNKAIIYNYKPYPTGEAGYVELAYETTKDTTNYTDMVCSTKVPAKIYATNNDTTVTKESEAEEVYIDTHATVAYTQKKKPTMYKSWSNLWGQEPEDANDYYYLIWPIRTYISKNTSSYDFYLNDVCTDMGSQVVGYRFSGQTEFSDINHIDNLITYGDRYDYVLTRYRKDEADVAIKNNERFYIHNDIEAIVSPSDHIDPDTNAASSYDWFYESPLYNGGNGIFWAEKYGIYGAYNRVESSEDVSNFMLGEFERGEIDALPGLKYRVIADGMPYDYTLKDGAAGGADDAINGLYWQKNVDYKLTDDGISIEGEQLEDTDFDIAQAELIPIIKEAEFDETSYSFKARKKTSGFKDSDNIEVMVRTTDGWHHAAVYNLNTRTYENIDNEYVNSSDRRALIFNAGVKALEYTCSHAYYYTEINIYPEISLFRTEHVKNILKNNPEKIAIENAINFTVSQNDNIILIRDTKASDYVQKVTRESQLKKNIIKTENIKGESRFEVTWNINFQEKYTDSTGLHYIYQDGGKFYDLLPAGCDFDKSSLVVSESGNILTMGEYSYTLTDNYKNSGRTLLTVDIYSPAKNEYAMQYITMYDYNSINDYGRNLLNSVVYESGNERIGGGLPDNGGNITDKKILNDIDPDTDVEKFAYAEARYEVNFPVAAVTGLKKQIKSSTSKIYSYNEVIHKDENYSYKIRLTNDSSTKAKGIVFFDSLENFYQDAGQDKETIASDWFGKLNGIDVSQMVYKGASPVIYLSQIKRLNPNEHNDLREKTADGKPVWVEYSEFEKAYGLDAARAVAIDASKRDDGSAFMLNEKESVSFTIYMRAPSEDKSNKQDPTAYNNIFVRRTAIKEVGDNAIEMEQFYHQDYTQAHYRISGDIGLKKVDATDTSNEIYGAVYKLTGTSDYGKFYDEEIMSGKNGQISFSEIEKGTYELKEVKCSDDWQLDKDIYKVIIDEKGDVIIDGLNKDENGVFLLEDEPRCHADIVFQKTDCVTNSTIEGVTFKLEGTSDYGNEYTLYCKSNKIGRIYFKNIELGIYTLKEVEAADGYIKMNETLTVRVNENGRAEIFNENKEEVKKSNDYYQVENEPYHSIRFLKSSTYGENIFLEGAEFNLTGISDYGTSVNMNAVSGKPEDGGLVVFNGLEPGTYTLRETRAPAGHYLDERLYNVVLHKDGTFIIDGLEKIQFGDKE